MADRSLFETYEMVVGLEIHAELRTQSKIFCRCAARYGEKPNTRICPVCLGFPGAMPVLNRRALELTVAAGVVTGCTIARRTHFDRKNYYYPDLPKGYQITQYDEPLCREGALSFETEEGTRTVRIQRIHLEEDAGKLFHGEEGTRVDYNRAGVPLIEIVSEPDIRSGAEAKAYLSALRERLLFAGISDCKMNEGSLRCDVNLSVRRRGEEALGIRTEIKNINSVQFVGKAVEYEFLRQAEILAAGGEILPETRRFDEKTGTTRLMRKKESVADYRYLREPDLPEILLEPADIEEIAGSLPPPAEAYRTRFFEAGLSREETARLTEHPETAARFAEALSLTAYPSFAAKLFLSARQPVSAAVLSGVADLLGEEKISAASARTLLSLCKEGEAPRAVAEREDLFLLTDPEAIAAYVAEAIRENPRALEDLRAGRRQAKEVLVGAVMKASRSRAKPDLVSEEIRRQTEEE